MTLERVRIFCFDMYYNGIDPCSPANYSRWLEAAVTQTRAHRPQRGHSLFVLPEYVTLPLIQNYLTNKFTEEFSQIFGSIAKNEKVYLLATSPLLNNSRPTNESWLFDPTGAVVMKHAKYDLTDLEQKQGITRPANRQTQALTLPFGAVGCATCLELFNDNHINELASNGVQILLVPSANPQPWAAPAQASGLWQPLEWAQGVTRTVSRPIRPIKVIVNPMLHGTIHGQEFDGQSSIIQASPVQLPCPYVGVKEKFAANFLYCSQPDPTQSTVGWADLLLT